MFFLLAISGNRWNCNRNSGKCGKGLGPQEEFYGCSDITIFPLRHTTRPPSPDLAHRASRVVVPNKHPPNTVAKVIKHALQSTSIRNSRPNTFIRPVKRTNLVSRIIPQNVARKRKLMNNLSGVLWKLLASLSNEEVKGQHIGLVKWNPASRSYTSDIVYVHPNLNQPTIGLKNRVSSTNNAASHWPPAQPMIVEASIDKPDMGPMILSEAPFDLQVRTKRVFGNINNISTCHGVNNFAKVSGISNWCTVNCRAGNCPRVMCTCSKDVYNIPPVSKTIKPPSRSFRQSIRKHKIYKSVRPRIHSSGIVPRARIALPVSRSGLVSGKNNLRCRGSGHFTHHRKMVGWCNSNCNRGFCPQSMCICK